MRVALENQNNSHSRYVFKKFMITVILYLVADMFSYVVDARQFFASKFLNHFSMFASISLTTYIGYLWNRFFDVVFNIGSNKKLRTCLYLTPFAISVVLLIVNIPTGMFYSIDSQNVYARGPLAMVNFLLQYLPFAVLVVRVIFHRFPVKTIRYIKLRNGFIWLGLLTLIFGMFQVLADGKIALQCLGMTASIFIMFSRFQDDQITNDVLTGLNNRHALETYVADKIRDYADGTHGKRRLYLVMMDINYFKRINDIYGHIEGDKALKTVAATLKKVGASYKSELFIARFGGDEFSAVFESESEKRVRQLCLDIKECLDSDTEELKYRISLGVGFALYEGKSMTIDELYGRADKALYDDKSKMKKTATVIASQIK